MTRYTDYIEDKYGNRVFGAAVAVLGANNQPASLVDDNGLALGNPLSTDAQGVFYFNAPAATYTLQFRRSPLAPIFATQSIILGAGDDSKLSIVDALSDLKGTAPTKKSVNYSGSLWTWTLGNYTGQADDLNIVKADSTALSVGAWVRQGAKGVQFRASGGAAVPRSTESKARDIRSLTDLLTDSAVDAIRGLSYTADVAPALQAAVNALATQGGGSLFVPCGRMRLMSTVTIPANVSIQGDGMGWVRGTGPTKGTQFHIAHNGHGLRTTASINDYTPSHNTFRDFAIYCEDPNASTGGMLYDQGGSYMRYERLFVHGGKYGMIFDQSEQFDLDSCIFFEQKHSGVWLVNGPDLNGAAQLGFTNRLTIARCEFNQPAKFGILDDGGLSHSYLDNNYNGCGISAIRTAGFCNTIVQGGEFEYSGSGDIRIARKSYNTPVRDVGAMQTVRVEGIFTTSGAGAGVVIEDGGTGPATVVAAVDLVNNHWRGSSGAVVVGAQYAVEVNTRGNVLGAGYTTLLDGRPTRFQQAEAIRRTTAAWDPPVIANGAVYSAQFALPNLRTTDSITASFSSALGAGVQLYATPVSAGTSSVTLRNDSGAGIDPAAGTLFLTVIPQEPF